MPLAYCSVPFACMNDCMCLPILLTVSLYGVSKCIHIDLLCLTRHFALQRKLNMVNVYHHTTLHNIVRDLKQCNVIYQKIPCIYRCGHYTFSSRFHLSFGGDRICMGNYMALKKRKTYSSSALCLIQYIKGI